MLLKVQNQLIKVACLIKYYQWSNSPQNCDVFDIFWKEIALNTDLFFCFVHG